MMTIERTKLTKADGGFDWEAAKKICGTEDDFNPAVYKAARDFEDGFDIIEIDPNYKQEAPIDEEYERRSHSNDFRYSEDMLELIETPGCLYDKDAGCFYIPRPRRV